MKYSFSKKKCNSSFLKDISLPEFWYLSLIERGIGIYSFSERKKGVGGLKQEHGDQNKGRAGLHEAGVKTLTRKKIDTLHLFIVIQLFLIFKEGKIYFKSNTKFSSCHKTFSLLQFNSSEDFSSLKKTICPILFPSQWL